MYLQHFEHWIATNKVLKIAWVELVANVLEGKVRTTYHTDIFDANVDDYD